MTPFEPESASLEEIRPEISREFLKIENDWLKLHFGVCVALAFVALAVECVLGAMVMRTSILTTSVERYILKFILAPSAVSFLLAGAAALILRAKRIPQPYRIYGISLFFTMICFVLYTAHSAFVSMIYLYAVAIMLTTVYANYYLTGTVTLFSIASILASELFIRWDLDKVSILESANRLFDFLIALVILVGCGAVCCVIIFYERKKNEAAIQKEIERALLRRKVQIDELTGVYSRKALHDAMRDIESAAGGGDIVFAIADIDHFKDVNDSFGHSVGDRCLMEFARVLAARFGGRSVFRYGGDEFCLLLRGMSAEDFLPLCAHAQEDLRRFRLEGVPSLRLTSSFGVAVFLPEKDNAARLFLHADRALYDAKRTRSAVRLFSAESGSDEEQLHI